MKPAILVSRHVFPEAIEILEPVAEIQYHDSSTGLSPGDLRAAVVGKQAVVCQLTDKIDAPFMDAGSDLKVISNVAVGFDNIDIPAATDRGIVVTNTPGVLTDTTADLAFTLMVSAARRICEADRFLRAGHWKQWEIDMMTGHDIYGHTLGIYGFGRIGQCMARRASGFDMRVIYHDAVRAAPEQEAELDVEYADRETLFRDSDFLSVHVPLNEQTRHAVGKDEFALMKTNAVLVNTSRGPVVDEKALADALEQGQIASAGLDVFEEEPAVEPRLLALENIVLVPHIGSASIKTRTRMCTMAAENTAAVLSGQRPPNPVNPEVL
ncbi:MAG: D-glycerate dehydrogenase [Woeseiaceae bacterium]|nr:D-glycerate dehydrogenase [Woeseiaceae bacterium]